MISKRKILLITGVSTIVVILIFVISIKFIRELRIRESIELGSKYLNEENYKEAIIEFEKVINIDERNTSIKNILNILYEYKSIDDLINANDYEKALEFIKRVEENEDSELINNLIVNAKERIEDNYDKIIENKKEYLDGYWAGDKFIMQFKKDEDSFLIFSLANDSNIDIYYNTITNFNYYHNEDVIEIESTESFDQNDSWERKERYKIIDENTIDIYLGDSKKTIKRISQKEAVLLYYGKYMDTVYNKYEAGLIYGYEYMDYVINIYSIDAFNYNEEDKDSYTGDDAIEFISGGKNKENYKFEEIDVLPGIRSYMVTDTTIPTRAAVKVVFEGDLIPDDINKRYLEYINSFEANDVSKEILSEDEAKKRVQEVTGLDEEKIYYIDYVNEPQRGISDENIAGYTVEVRGISKGGGTISIGGDCGFFFVVSSNGAVYKSNIVKGGIYELIAN